ncbi:pyruvate kinase [Manduca sexta]|uniref:pyruvate kinase n=1 Tax=Manduca sexta TaxID=7130 RepID=UPI001181CCCA|nr:pyruvate kinase [Manduca sexta]
METTPELITFGEIDFTDANLLNRPPYRLRRSPIIVTLPNVNISVVDIQKFMETGMNVARLRTSHITRGDKIKLLGKVDKAAAALCGKHAVLDWPTASCIELKTSIVRTGILQDGESHIFLKEGNPVILTCNLEEYDKCNEKRIFVDIPELITEITVGTEISIAQDEIIMNCKQIIDENSIKCVISKGGQLKSLYHVSAKGRKRTRPVVTKKDLQIIKFALEYQVDMIIINYVQKVETLKKIKQYIGTRVKRPLLIAGLCTAEGLENIDDLIVESDGIMFSREFLTYELDRSQKNRMCQLQKWVGAKCQKAGKPYYISGGVFKEALSDGIFCNREISDVTNAILDGATGFAIKASENVEYILRAIKALNDVCCAVEPLAFTKSSFIRILDEMKMPLNAAEASVMACATAANQTKSRVIVLPTVTGRTARSLLWLKPCCIIIAVSERTRTTRLLSSYRCVVPLLYHAQAHKEYYKAVEARVQFAIEYAVKKDWLVYGDNYVTLQKGSESSSFCDTVKIWRVTVSRKALVVCLDDEN